MRSKKTQQFIEHLTGLHGVERVLVVLHDNPDPDCVASGLGLSRIFTEVLGAKTMLGYGGIVGRAENRVMIQRVGARNRMVRLSEVDFSQFQLIVTVDTQPRTGNNSLPEDLVPHMVIDHHPRHKGRTKGVAWVDIRPRYGATATIVYEYLQALQLAIDRKLATAIVYAIRTETHELGREASPPDRRAYRNMSPLSDPLILFDITHAKVPRNYFQMMASALANANIYEEALVTNLLDIDNPDHVAEVADMLLRLEGVSWTLVMGRYEQNVHLSLRTLLRDADAGEIMEKLVRKIGSGGGHEMGAGGKIPEVEGDVQHLRRLEEGLTKIFLKAINAKLRAGEALVQSNEESDAD